MKCANPACGGELFKVKVLLKEENLAVELTCAKCGKVVKAWVTNEQLKALNRQVLALHDGFMGWSQTYADLINQIGRLADAIAEKKKSWWRRG